MDDERRRIERALHDGVQQDLIALAVRLQLARRLAATDLAATLALLDEIGRDVHDALGRVRALANEIYPSLLDTQGLAEALRGGASAAGVATHVEADGVGRYGAEVEAAVYFCCRAALEGVASHAGPGARATIRLREEAGTLHFEVTGDGAGAGLDPDTRDRIKALSGVLTIEPEPGGGTRVSASLPLSEARPARSSRF